MGIKVPKDGEDSREMEPDFFNEDNQDTEEQTSIQRDPAPAVAAIPASGKPKKKWWQILLCVLLALFLFFSGFLVCWSTLDPEIRTLIGVKKKIQKEYYKEISDEEFYKAIFGGLNDSLDAYSKYMTAEEYAAALRDLEGNREGLGLVFTGEAEGLRILRVCGNSPAEQAGILAGESVSGYGKTAENMTPCKNFEELSAFLETCKAEENFCLQIKSLTESVRTVTVCKKAYIENDVFYHTKTTACAFLNEEEQQKGEAMSYLPEDAAYIRLVQFSGKAATEFDKAMARFQKEGKKHLVLDLRGNGGGYLDTMQSIATYFCKEATDKKPAVAVADYGEKKVSYHALGNRYQEYFVADSRIFVLADSHSASASECLIGCMLDYKTITYANLCLAKRAGVAKTYGKGIMQETYLLNLMQQDAIKLTTAEIRWPKTNTSIHGRGILETDGTLTVEENYQFAEETKAAIAQCFPA